MFFIALRLRLPFPHVTEHCDHWVQSQLSLQDYEINQTNIQKKCKYTYTGFKLDKDLRKGKQYASGFTIDLFEFSKLLCQRWWLRQLQR